MKRPRRIFLVITVLCLFIIAGTQCITNDTVATDRRGPNFAGADKCAACHKNIHTSFINTAHNKSSAAASGQTVKGNFKPPSNEYIYSPEVKVMMEDRDSGLYQVAYMNGIEKRASRFDIAIGSGRKAQTYLYWDNNNIFQLPVSWFVPAKNWANSPNYPAHQVRFDRNIPIGCFECHGSYIKVTSTEQAGARLIDNYDKNRIVYGIDCERCHGQGAKHVSFHETNREEKKAKYITTYASLSSQQKTDMCAVCHSGLHQNLKSTFYFKPGDKLSDFFVPTTSPDITTIDVHGNQAQLMTASNCFIKSTNLTCTSCHNVDTAEKDNIAIFSARCMNCHKEANHNFCKMADSIGSSIINNCIDCHMPAMPSKLITLLSNGQESAMPNMVRTHLISIYPTKKSGH